ncbi:MAG: hypothetical protein ACPHE0_07165, partial [Pseudomonadales bacterium]
MRLLGATIVAAAIAAGIYVFAVGEDAPAPASLPATESLDEIVSSPFYTDDEKNNIAVFENA